MKKLLFLFIAMFSIINVFAQSEVTTVLPNNTATSGNGRAPQGISRSNRGVWLITAAEMSASGFTAGSVINSLGFNYLTALNVASTSTTFNVYLQNTTDVTNSKSTTWATAIAAMTLASNANITLPATTGTVDFPFSGGTTFTYTGGGLYVAFDYQNLSSIALPTVANVASCTNTLTGGIKSAFSQLVTPIVTTITASNFRPETRLGKLVTCSKPTNLVSSATTTSSNTVSWTAPVVAPAEGYEYYYSTTNTTPLITTAPTGTTSFGVNTVNLTGLMATTSYYFWVRSACNGLEKSEWSSILAFNTTVVPSCGSLVSPLDLATNVTVNLSNNTTTPTTRETSVLLSWTAPTAGNQTGYNIYLGTTLSNITLINTTPFVGTSVNITGYFVYNTTYFWQIVPVNAGGEAIGCDTRSFTTIADPSYCLNGQLYPAASFTPTTCDGVTVNNVNTDAFAGEYSNIVVVAGQNYSFSSSVSTDRITISSDAGLTSAASGVSPLIWTALNTGTIRFYLNINNCDVQNTNRTKSIICGASLSNNSFSGKEFSISPNPADKFINISNTENIYISEINITDLNGRIVKSQKISNVSNIEINVADLTTGIYLMNINTEKGIVTKKIMKN